VWTADGSGGDKRGRLLATQTYDDGQCYQVNGGPVSTQRQKQFPHEKSQEMGGDLWCQTDIQLPQDAEKGKPYTLYWVWDWSTMGGGANPGLPQGLTEIYTTCMDVDVVEGGKVEGTAAAAYQQQDLGKAAVKAVFEKISSGTGGSSGGSSNDNNDKPKDNTGGNAPQPAVSSAPASSSSAPAPPPSSAPQPSAKPSPPPPQQPQFQNTTRPQQQQPPRPTRAPDAPQQDGQAPQQGSSNINIPTPSIKTVYVTLVPSTLTAGPTDLAKRADASPSPSVSPSPSPITELVILDASVKLGRRHRYG
jgi:hypothetical protein